MGLFDLERPFRIAVNNGLRGERRPGLPPSSVPSSSELDSVFLMDLRCRNGDKRPPGVSTDEALECEDDSSPPRFFVFFLRGANNKINSCFFNSKIYL